ncbi:MAG TPA: dihydrofolate reductase, partial [Parapedobacter sp.]|nr:dihydrofolate reductase [Parapedobacter sp.]
NDLRFFKRTTTGHTVIMGRKTYESVGKPLPNRRNIIITRQAAYAVEGAEVVHSLTAALDKSADESEVFVVGGAEIYKEALAIIDRIYLTRVHITLPGDSFFPELDEQTWRLVSEDSYPADERHAYRYTFQIYERR